MPLRVIGFAGSQSTPSKTRLLVDTAARQVAARFGGSAETYELSDLQPALGGAGSLGEIQGKPRAIIDAILSADALIVGSPVYKGSFSGLFKHLFDLIDPAALAGKPVLLTATGGGEKHALVIEHQLRPLFGFFEAAVLPTGVYAASSDFAGDALVTDALLQRLDRAVGQFAPWLARNAAGKAA